MATETERLGRIVSDFLDLTRLERGLAPPLRRRRVDAAALVSDAVELLRRGRTTHELEWSSTGPLPELDADPDALDRVVKNLVGNALKYSPAGTRVRVAAARAAPRVRWRSPSRTRARASPRPICLGCSSPTTARREPPPPPAAPGSDWPS